MGSGILHTWGLVVLTANAAFGGVIFMALLTRGPVSYIPTALIGALAAFLVEPQVGGLTGAAGVPAWPLLATLGGAAAAVGIRYLVDGALKNGKGMFESLAHVREIAPDILVPERWKMLGGPATTTPRDQVRRWFVAISAATGAVVGSIVGLDLFWSAFMDAIFYRRLMFTILFTAVSMFLIGPIQAYIFGLGAGDGRNVDPGKDVADFFSRGIDWRAAGRLGIVVLAAAQLSILSSCIEVVAQRGEAEVILRIMIMAITPAIAGYYWSAALQLNAHPVRKAIFDPTLYAGGIMNYGLALPFLVIVFLYWLTSEPNPHPGNLLILIISPVLAILLAGLMALITTTLYAWLGAWAIDKAAGRHTMVAVSASIVVAGIINQLIVTMPIVLLAIAITPSSEAPLDFFDTVVDWTFVGHIVGWIAGLWASGFPGIVKASTPARASAPAASPS
jgi:hypothetical protein